ncbi:hypothetical protein KIN20_022569 [Parelaphostrongylus tenuis]|uniref:Uncharacterized protein n=1 Tax=Parelaphostrongylus tenuis TaxID=148309 RepID=A0AAD5MQD8_PARTN|nr:hypothetical protein KIN20_022569 [Parelaphostrongylus tenuis]
MVSKNRQHRLLMIGLLKRNNRLYWTEGNYSVVKASSCSSCFLAWRHCYRVFLLADCAFEWSSVKDQELYCNPLAGRTIMRLSMNSISGLRC